MTHLLDQAAELIRRSRFTAAFTGAGISVESGIPPFRGPGGLWERYDPKALDLGYFHEEPLAAWIIIKEIFYDFLGSARPNEAHRVLARLEQEGKLGRIITQNIDNLHQEAGSALVTEFHGNSKMLRCLHCHRRYRQAEISLDHLPPTCRECGGLLKPDFIFFGESIPRGAYLESVETASIADVLLVIGTTGEVVPANQVPVFAKEAGAAIIEINPEPSNYTRSGLTTLFLQGKATEILLGLESRLFPAALDDDQ